jgi:hypothetical protein
MALPTPDDIRVKAKHAYPRFLTQWINGTDENFFPYHVRVRFAVDAKDVNGTILASERLLNNSKTKKGWGYTVRREQRRMREFGNNPVPQEISIDTLDDLLRLANKRAEFRATCRVVDAVRGAIPKLSLWLEINVRRLHRLAKSVDGLLQVTQFFMSHPWPDCYARQIPVPVDTKFVQRHRATLRQWFDELLPSSGIDVNENVFTRRFGLRDGQNHRGIRALDPELALELGLVFHELSLPMRSVAALPVKCATVVILENDLNLFTLPRIARGLGIRGEGNAVNRLEQLRWLDSNRVLYWGDIDVEGFVILSRLRNVFPHVESVLMDLDVLMAQKRFVIAGNGSQLELPTNLTPAESQAFCYCRENNLRLEQERILQSHVDNVFLALGSRPANHDDSR